MRKLLIMIVLAAVATFPLGAAAETKLRLTLQLPLKHHLGQNVQAFKEEVERETGGEIKVEIYPSAQLYKDKEVPQAVASGAIEMGVASLTRFAGTVPAVDIFYVPFMFDSEAKVRAATAPESRIRQTLDQEILKTGTRVLWWQAFGGTIVLSKKNPIRTPDDVRGKKVRVFGKTIGDTVTALGGAPTLMSGSEQFVAYQRGTVDAGMTGVTAVKSRKLYQVMDFLTLTNHADIEFIVLINEKTWQSLSDKQREVITKAARRVETELRNQMGQLEQEALNDVRDKIKVIDLSDADRELWRKSTESVVDSFIERTRPLGAELVSQAKNL
ncbi:MAG: TRAP transporter substrate-binding protein DctP [Gammaproteobacteria bacterium]|nr:TRAP transporter substrate-binding protein DctP [Gammaproteobacteria bacterium]MDH3412881.1 TRAP transporter substrate-binding protein DctP [Gammaproteobacteria bacterium]